MTKCTVRSVTSTQPIPDEAQLLAEGIQLTESACVLNKLLEYWAEHSTCSMVWQYNVVCLQFIAQLATL